MNDEPDVILDFEASNEAHQPLVIATIEQRLVNYIIDLFAIFVLVGLLIVPLSTMFDISEMNSDFTLKSYFIVDSVLILYFCTLEYLTGKTLGKMITKTKVVTNFGEKPSLLNIFGRTVCRFIPFELISFLYGDETGWHDSISKTLVVKE